MLSNSLEVGKKKKDRKIVSLAVSILLFSQDSRTQPPPRVLLGNKKLVCQRQKFSSNKLLSRLFFNLVFVTESLEKVARSMEVASSSTQAGSLQLIMLGSNELTSSRSSGMYGALKRSSSLQSNLSAHTHSSS